MELFTSQLNLYKRATQNFALIKIEAAVVLTESGIILSDIILDRYNSSVNIIGFKSKKEFYNKVYGYIQTIKTHLK